MSCWQSLCKRTFDVFFSVLGLFFVWPILLIISVVIRIFDSGPVIFTQDRIGENGGSIRVHKFRTMEVVQDYDSTVTVTGDSRITPIGAILRRYKLDELPQLWNVLVGDMSFVGPRPDVPGFADKLEGEERTILSLRPGITGPATLKYRNEEELLAGQDDPESYNREVIWPDKVRINLEYMRDWSLLGDIKYILKTIL